MALTVQPAAMRTHSMATRFIFLMLGIAVSAWALLVPYAKARLGVNEAVLGMLFLLIGFGALLSMPFAGRLTSRYGCRKTLLVSSALFLLSLVSLAFVASTALFAVSLFLFGASSGIVDVAMNIQAVLVEREYGKSMMSGFHCMYSIGGCIGASVLSVLINAGATPLLATALLCALLALVLLFPVAAWLFPHGSGSENASGSWFVLPKSTIILLGILCFVLYMCDGAVLDWSALYLISDKSVPGDMAGLAFSVFSVAIAIGRFFGDRLIDRFGIDRVMKTSALVAAGGYMAVVFSPTQSLAFAAFVVVGLGSSNLIPILFAVAARQKRVPVDEAISSVTTLGYLGLLVGPPILGFIAHSTALYSVFAISAVLVLLSGMAARKISSY